MRHFALSTAGLLVLLCSAMQAGAQAPLHIQFDTLADNESAELSCGFCAGEKFGVVFRELPLGKGLPADAFPLTVLSVDVALAAVNVEGLFCVGSTAGGDIDTEMEIFAGPVAPSGDISQMPASGPWPNETTVATGNATIPLSVETSPGTQVYNANFYQIELPDGGIVVDKPNTYIRVVLTIPTGSGSSLCSFGGLSEPAGVAFRDVDGRTANELNFIYALSSSFDGAVSGGWHWNESTAIEDPLNPQLRGIAGDWGLRLNVQPEVFAQNPDQPTPAGTGGETSQPDVGTTPEPETRPEPDPDAGLPGGGGSDPEPDAGEPQSTGGNTTSVEGATGGTQTPATDDAGVVTTPPAGDTDASVTNQQSTGGSNAATCNADLDCAGGEQCVANRCQPVSCGAVADCAGGMTCISGRCRNLCMTASDCQTDERCDTVGGYCAPTADTSEGCSCRIAGGPRSATPTSGRFATLGFLALAATIGLRQRRRRDHRQAPPEKLHDR